MVSMMRDLPEYKFWRRIWWIAMGIAFVVIILTWLPSMLISSGVLSEDFKETASWISTVGFIFAIVALILAFYIDLRKIRKIQKAQEAKARNLTKSERQELDKAIAASIERDQQRRAERKSKMPWGKKKTRRLPRTRKRRVNRGRRCCSPRNTSFPLRRPTSRTAPVLVRD